MSKNSAKSRLTLVFKELWTFFIFRREKIFLECDFGENGFLKNLWTKNVLTLLKIKKSQCLKLVLKAVSLSIILGVMVTLVFQKKK